MLYSSLMVGRMYVGDRLSMEGLMYKVIAFYTVKTFGPKTPLHALLRCSSPQRSRTNFSVDVFIIVVCFTVVIALVAFLIFIL
jgi:hypothetical protein